MMLVKYQLNLMLLFKFLADTKGLCIFQSVSIPDVAAYLMKGLKMGEVFLGRSE